MNREFILKGLPQSDIMGAIASGLCAIHCMATPFLFLAQSCSLEANTCGQSGPFWWGAIDYLFIGITYFAVYQSGKTTSKPWIKHTLYIALFLLTIFVLNEKIGIIVISAWWKYISAFGLIILHIYNLKFCKCAEEVCCAN